MTRNRLRFWHKRFTQQARWTSVLRRYFFDYIALPSSSRILEVGCGTGAVLKELPSSKDSWGIDLNFTYLRKARRITPESKLVSGNGCALPFQTGSFSVAFCHYLLLWIQQPLELISEMIRVTHKGGYIAFFAEPDYTPVNDAPEEFMEIKRIQCDALFREGANPFIGSRLNGFLESASLHNIQSGEYLPIDEKSSHRDASLERKVFKRDYYLAHLTESRLLEFKKAISLSHPAFHTKTYYAFGQVC